MDRAARTSGSDLSGVEGTNDSGEGTRVDAKRALEEMEEIYATVQSVKQELEQAREEIKNLKAENQELKAKNEKTG